MSSRRTIVVGGGITGLVAARELAKDPTTEVLLLEATERIGGQIRTVELDGTRVDVGAEAIHLGAPHVAALVRELGLAESVVAAAPGSSVMATRKGLRPLPAGVGPTGPTRIWPVLRSGILTPRGILRAGLEPLMARQKVTGDVSVGSFTARRFGREVTDTFVDPLLGNLHGGDIHQLSLQATAPQLVPDARGGVSLLAKNLRPPKGLRLPGRTAPTRPAAPAAAPAGGKKLPMFASWPDGLETFTRALAEQSAARIRTLSPVERLEREGDGWLVTITGGEQLRADEVLLTTPGPVSAELLRELSPAAAAMYQWVPDASVATVVLGYRREAVRGNPTMTGANGILLPNRLARTFKAATNLARKWPGLASEHHLVRASVGRSTHTLAEDLSDEEMATRVADEIAELTGLTARPELSVVHRWPHAMPQLLTGHKERVERARAELAGLPGLEIAGSSVDGLGIGGTVRSGQSAAARIVARRGAAEDSDGAPPVAHQE